jgi:hypothetical protein
MSINRWGNNLFWFNQFFTNFHFQSLFQKFGLIERWLAIIFKYGFNFQLKFLYLKRSQIPSPDTNFKYFRIVTKSDPLPNEKQKYRLRLANDDLLFPSFWFFRFQNSLICLVNFFPLREDFRNQLAHYNTKKDKKNDTQIQKKNLRQERFSLRNVMFFKQLSSQPHLKYNF